MREVFVMNWANTDDVVIQESGRAVCSNTRLYKMSLDGFVSAYTNTIGGDYDENWVKIASSGYKRKRGRPKVKAETFTISSPGPEGQSTSVFTARLEDEIAQLISLNSELTT